MLGALSFVRMAAAALLCGALAIATTADAQPRASRAPHAPYANAGRLHGRGRCADHAPRDTLNWGVDAAATSSPYLRVCLANPAASTAFTVSKMVTPAPVTTVPSPVAASGLPLATHEPSAEDCALERGRGRGVELGAEEVAEKSDWKGSMAGSGVRQTSGDGQQSDQGPLPGPLPEAIDLGTLDDTGEDDFNSFEDALFHARLYLDGLRWVERSLPGAAEPSDVYSRLEDGRCDRPPRV